MKLTSLIVTMHVFPVEDAFGPPRRPRGPEDDGALLPWVHFLKFHRLICITLVCRDCQGGQVGLAILGDQFN